MWIGTEGAFLLSCWIFLSSVPWILEKIMQKQLVSTPTNIKQNRATKIFFKKRLQQTHMAFGLEISRKSFVWGCSLTYLPLGRVTFFTVTVSPSCRNKFSIIYKVHIKSEFMHSSWTEPKKTESHRNDMYPIWHIYHALFCNELQNPTVRNPLRGSISKLKQHWVINVKWCCKILHSILNMVKKRTSCQLIMVQNLNNWKCQDTEQGYWPRRSRAEGGIITGKNKRKNNIRLNAQITYCRSKKELLALLTFVSIF